MFIYLKQHIFLLFLCCFPLMSFAQGLDDSFQISASGIIVQKVRISLIAENISNISVFQVEETGLPYQKQYPVIKPAKYGARITEIAKSDEPFTRYYDPAAPQTDKNGFYYFPNVNLPDEMVNLTFSESMYQANINVLKTVKSMYQTTIDALK